MKLNGEMAYLWRAVDHEGEVLESYGTKTRDKAAALSFMKKTLKGAVKLTGLSFVGAGMDPELASGSWNRTVSHEE